MPGMRRISDFEDLKALQFSRTIRLQGRNLNYSEPYTSIEDRITKAKERGETELSLSFMKLTEWPESIFELTALTSLDLSNNQLTSIPAGIGQLKNLRMLMLDNNPIHIVDNKIQDLTELRTLRMNACMLTAFPLSILGLRKLQTLAMEGNQVRWIPVGLKDIETLEEIDLGKNPVMNLPKEFHITTSARLHHYYKALEEEVEVEQPMIMGIGFDVVDKIKPNLEDQLWGDFNPMTGETVHFSGYMTKSLGNPNGVLLFNRLYQYLDHVKMLQISAPSTWTSLHDPEGNVQPFTKADLAEIMACLPVRTPDTRVLALHIENGWEMMESFVTDDFDVKLIRNWRMSLPPGARYIEVIKDFMDGTSIAFAIAKILSDPTGAYIVASPPTQQFLSATSLSLSGAEPTRQISSLEYFDQYLLHVIVCRIPQLHFPDLAKKAGINWKPEEGNNNPWDSGRQLLAEAISELRLPRLIQEICVLDKSLTTILAPYISLPT